MSEEYVTFRPVYQRGDQLVVADENLSEEFRNNIEFVLRFYKVRYRLSEEGRVLIPREVWQDRDTIWNYTTKASDPQWLETHRQSRGLSKNP